MANVRETGAPPADSEEIREATLEEVADEGNWKLHRGGESGGRHTFDLCNSIRVWMQAVSGGYLFQPKMHGLWDLPSFMAAACGISAILRAIESNIYFERIVNDGEEKLELVRCPYNASSYGLVPAATSRALMVSLLMSLSEEYSFLKWLILVWSSLEVFLGVRGQSCKTTIKECWTPLFLRGLLPSFVGLIGSSYSQAVFLLLVSALPFYRGNIRTTWVMAPGTMAVDVCMNVLFALLVLFFIVFMTSELLDYDGYSDVISNPIALLVVPNFDELEVSLDDTDSVLAIIFSFLVFQIFKRGSAFLEPRLVMFQGALYSHPHSRLFYSWRVRSAINTLREIIEPSLGLAEIFLSVFASLLVLLVCAVEPLNVPVFALTYMAYEIDLGYMMENDVVIMTAFNLLINNPGDLRYAQCIVTGKGLQGTSNGQNNGGGATTALGHRHDVHTRRLVFDTSLGTNHGNDLPLPIISNELVA